MWLRAAQDANDVEGVDFEQLAAVLVAEGKLVLAFVGVEEISFREGCDWLGGEIKIRPVSQHVTQVIKYQDPVSMLSNLSHQGQSSMLVFESLHS